MAALTAYLGSFKHGLFRARRFPVVLAFVVTLGVASVLVVLRVSTVDIALEVAASELSFELRSQHELIAPTSVVSAGFAGARAILFPLAIRGEEFKTAVAEFDHSLRFTAGADDGSGRVTVLPVVLPAGTRVAIGTESATSHRFTIAVPEDTEAIIPISVIGQVKVGSPGREPFDLLAETPKLFQIVVSKNPIQLEIETFEESTQLLSAHLRISNLLLSTIVESRGPGGTDVARTSTIRSGIMHMDSLDRDRIDLRPGDALSFERSAGELRATRFSGSDIQFVFSGQVQGMTGGLASSPVNLMPSMLMWMAKNQTLALLWSAVLFVFGTWLTLARWWKTGEDQERKA